MDKGLSYQGMIAPCGMNCGICIGHLREKRPCGGCFGREEKNRPETCKSCSIVNCDFLAKTESGFCFDCDKYPCARLEKLDKRYRAKYHMSMIENLDIINNKGLEAFLTMEDSRWKCRNCGSGLSVHRDVCLKCESEINWEV